MALKAVDFTNVEDDTNALRAIIFDIFIFHEIWAMQLTSLLAGCKYRILNIKIWAQKTKR